MINKIFTKAWPLMLWGTVGFYGMAFVLSILSTEPTDMTFFLITVLAGIALAYEYMYILPDQIIETRNRFAEAIRDAIQKEVDALNKEQEGAGTGVKIQVKDDPRGN